MRCSSTSRTACPSGSPRGSRSSSAARCSRACCRSGWSQSARGSRSAGRSETRQPPLVERARRLAGLHPLYRRLDRQSRRPLDRGRRDVHGAQHDRLAGMDGLRAGAQSGRLGLQLQLHPVVGALEARRRAAARRAGASGADRRAPEASNAAIASSADRCPRGSPSSSPRSSVASQRKRSTSRASSTSRSLGAASPEYASVRRHVRRRAGRTSRACSAAGAWR